MKRILALMLVATFALVACEGDTGSVGPAGPQGAQGEIGPQGPGTRIVYEGAIPSGGNIVIQVPELTLDDMPLIAVYYLVLDPTGDYWVPVNYYWETPDTDEIAAFEFVLLYEGQVEIVSWIGSRYKIILIV